MASKTKVNGHNGMHTAGIYSDMTVDGPEIGTLVVIVDRAKNLPNRKTIGKQDPYCAARLGKEAKKTETDRRGGQTPRWDQELRFTVHDSPDYYQLKVSVFNDDKRTDLIGETWVNLQEIIIPGGGQNDIWHTLNCKSKYAGEIRIEITYYDIRPKQERPEKSRPSATNGVDEGSRESLKGPRQPKGPVKRRPLPSDPVTGAPPPQAFHDEPPSRGYPPPTAIPDHIHTPSRGQSSSTYIPNRSPLQSVEYSTPTHSLPQTHSHNDSPHSYATPTGMTAFAPARQPLNNERYEIYDPAPPHGSSPGHRDDYNRQEDHGSPYRHYDYQSPSEHPHSFEPESPLNIANQPPPPPAHRSRHASQHANTAPVMTHQDGYELPSDPRRSHSYDIPSHDMHRQSMPSYSQPTPHQAYNPPTSDQFRRSGGAPGVDQSMPRHHSYDSSYQNNYSSMQPTVEDAPPTPSPAHYSEYRNSGPRGNPQPDARSYVQDPAPAPLNFNGRNSASSGTYSTSTAPSTQYSNGYGPTSSQLSFGNQTVSSQSSYSSMPHQQPPRRQNSDLSDDRIGAGTSHYGLPSVPPSLVPGMDPSIAQDISDRIYAESRGNFGQNPGNAPQSKRYESPQYQQNRSRPLSYHETAASSSPGVAVYNDRQSRYSTVAAVPVMKPRAISPDPRVPLRKSVSPAPETPDRERRLSGVPFGPDSFNVLNPALNGSAPALSARYDTKEPDPDAKIITHDGREIDPSDHIPESNYAPLLEAKGPKYASQMPDRNYRPPPGAGQQNLERTPVHQPGRPHSIAVSSPIYTGHSDPSTPQSGRNRLQKKTNRMSAQAAPHSSPLAPISPHQYNSYNASPRSLPRAHTVDFANEDYGSPHYASGPRHRGSTGPPIPAKIMVGAQPPPPPPNGPDAWALLEEMKNIDLGQGRARRKGRF